MSKKHILLSEVEKDLMSYIDKFSSDDLDIRDTAEKIIDNMVVGVNLFSIGEELAIPTYGGTRPMYSVFIKAGLTREEVDHLIVLYYRILYFPFLVIGKENMSRKQYKQACDDYIKKLTYKQYFNFLKAPANEMAGYLMNVKLLSKLYSDEVQRLPLREVENLLHIRFDTSQKVSLFLRDAAVEFAKGGYIDKLTNTEVIFVSD